jgi:MoaA/NifB/PqqE/SkfB family radical SAM enzyme
VSADLQECPNLNVTVALGIDGLKPNMNSAKAHFWDPIDTARQLQTIKKEFKQLDVQTCTCFMNSNQDTIFDWYNFLKYDLQPDKVNFNYIRPPSADPKELEIDHSRYTKLAQMIDDDSRHAAIKNNYGGSVGFFKAAIDIYMHGLIARTQETQTAQMKCYAGTAGGVIYDEGTVSSCENLEPIGNLREFDWNFQKLWLSPAMQERRKKAADGCFCTHESNSYYPCCVQSKAPDSDQKTRARNEESPGANRSSTGAGGRSCCACLKCRPNTFIIHKQVTFEI